MSKRIRCFLGICLFLTAAEVAQADILTDPSEMSDSNTLIDFESFAAGPVGSPLEISGATFSGAGSLEIIDSSPYSPTPVVHRNVLRGHDGSQSLDMMIVFSTPVSEIGFGMWDPNLAGNFLRVYDANDVLLESAEFPTDSPGGHFAAFRGIRRSSNEIAYATLDLAATNEYYGIDNVSFGATAVPEPSGLLVVLLGGSYFVMARRERR